MVKQNVIYRARVKNKIFFFFSAKSILSNQVDNDVGAVWVILGSTFLLNV